MGVRHFHSGSWTFDRMAVLHERLEMSGPGTCSNANRSHLQAQLASPTTLRQARWVPILVIGMRDGTDTRRLRHLPSPMYPGVRMRTAANASGTVRPWYASGAGVGLLVIGRGYVQRVIGTPVSARLRIEAIWASVNFDFFMEPPGWETMPESSTSVLSTNRGRLTNATVHHRGHTA